MSLTVHSYRCASCGGQFERVGPQRTAPPATPELCPQCDDSERDHDAAEVAARRELLDYEDGRGSR